MACCCCCYCEKEIFSIVVGRVRYLPHQWLSSMEPKGRSYRLACCVLREKRVLVRPHFYFEEKEKRNREKLKKKNEGNFDEIYELLQKVTREIIRQVKPGVKVADLDKKARKMLGKYAQYFTHSLGHGVGIDIHEAP